MSKRQNPLYQGRDWFSYRWTVAQAFDALERIQDLCLCATDDERASADSPLFSYLSDLTEILGAQLAIVYADILAADAPLPSVRQGWDCFEARQSHNSLIAALRKSALAPQKTIDRIHARAVALKELLKKIDT